MPASAAELVGRLRAELGPVVDASARRRAEYSSDASNYRVVPQGVVFPRSVDDVLAAAAVCRELAAPLTVRGGGTSIAGNAVGPGVVLDLSRHLDQVHRRRPGRAYRHRPAGRGPGPAAAGRAAARPAVRARSLDPLAVHDRRDDRQQLVRRARDGVRHHRRQRGVPGRARRHRAAAARRARAATVPGLDAFVAGRLEPLAGEFGRFRRQVSGYSLEHLLPSRNGQLARALTGIRGHLLHRAGCDGGAGAACRPRPPCACSATRTCPPPPTTRRR